MHWPSPMLDTKVYRRFGACACRCWADRSVAEGCPAAGAATAGAVASGAGGR